MTFKAAIGMLAVVSAAACAPARDYTQATLSQAALGNLSPASLGYDAALSQVVTGELLGEGKSLRFELEVTGNTLVLVGLTHTGIPLFTLRQDGADRSFDSTVPPDSALNPAYLLADIKLAYWPSEALNLTLGPLRMRVYERVEHGARHRVLKDESGQTIAEVLYPPGGPTKGNLILRRYDIPYRLRIKTLNLPKRGAQ